MKKQRLALSLRSFYSSEGRWSIPRREDEGQRVEGLAQLEEGPMLHCLGGGSLGPGQWETNLYPNPQMTGRYAMYAEELAKASQPDYRPHIIKE